MKLLLGIPRVLGNVVAPANWWTAVLAVLASAAEYLLPGDVVKSMVIGLGLLVVMDTLTGIRAAVKQGDPIKSGQWGILDKTLAYTSIIAVFAVVGRNVPGLESYFSTGLAAVLTFMLLREAVSILENVSKLGVNLPPALLDKLRGKANTGHNDNGTFENGE